MKNKQIVKFKQGKSRPTRNQKLLKQRGILIERIIKLNDEIHSGRKLGLHKALNKKYYPYLSKKGGATVGCKLSLPLCFIGKTIKLRIVKEK